MLQLPLPASADQTYTVTVLESDLPSAIASLIKEKKLSPEEVACLPTLEEVQAATFGYVGFRKNLIEIGGSTSDIDSALLTLANTFDLQNPTTVLIKAEVTDRHGAESVIADHIAEHLIAQTPTGREYLKTFALKLIAVWRDEKNDLGKGFTPLNFLPVQCLKPTPLHAISRRPDIFLRDHPDFAHLYRLPLSTAPDKPNSLGVESDIKFREPAPLPPEIDVKWNPPTPR